MGKLLAKERQKEIVEYINSTGSAKIGDLADKFEVTKETIRRDLTHLQEIGAIAVSYTHLPPNIVKITPFVF